MGKRNKVINDQNERTEKQGMAEGSKKNIFYVFLLETIGQKEKNRR